jgi:hypothetical protein
VDPIGAAAAADPTGVDAAGVDAAAVDDAGVDGAGVDAGVGAPGFVVDEVPAATVGLPFPVIPVPVPAGPVTPVPAPAVAESFCWSRLNSETSSLSA